MGTYTKRLTIEKYEDNSYSLSYNGFTEYNGITNISYLLELIKESLEKEGK